MLLGISLALRCGLDRWRDLLHSGFGIYLVLGRMSELTENYLRDLGFLLKEEWKASERALHESSSEQRQYEAGHNRAYRRVLSLMLQQAEAFDLPLSAICLEGIDRDKDLSC